MHEGNGMIQSYKAIRQTLTSVSANSSICLLKLSSKDAHVRLTYTDENSKTVMIELIDGVIKRTYSQASSPSSIKLELDSDGNIIGIYKTHSGTTTTINVETEIFYGEISSFLAYSTIPSSATAYYVPVGEHAIVYGTMDIGGATPSAQETNTLSPVTTTWDSDGKQGIVIPGDADIDTLLASGTVMVKNDTATALDTSNIDSKADLVTLREYINLVISADTTFQSVYSANGSITAYTQN